MKRKRFCIGVGGTGGHIIPGIALAERAKEKGVNVLIVGRRGSMEERLVKESGLDFLGYPYFTRSIFSLPGQLMALVWCLIFLHRAEVSKVLACGSYATLPLILASIILRRALFLLEQNRIPGRMIKLFAPFAQYVFFGFAPGGKVKCRVKFTGNPIRKGIKAMKEIKEKRPSAPQVQPILVLGGSQGARFLSQYFKEVARKFPGEKFLIQVRSEDQEKIAQDSPDNCQFFVFTMEIERLLAEAKLVISRAGGSSLSEILFLGIPAILVPYPYATQDHQLINAKTIEGSGGCLVLEEKELKTHSQKVEEILGEIIRDEKKRKEMAKRARDLSKDGTEEILVTMEVI